MFWISFSGGQGDENKYEYMLKIKSTEPQPDYLFTGARRSVSCEVSHKEMKEKSTALDQEELNDKFSSLPSSLPS